MDAKYSLSLMESLFVIVSMLMGAVWFCVKIDVVGVKFLELLSVEVEVLRL